MSAPKVSIACITYNQRKYIRQALDGFLMQKTNFDFEVLINDDASTDGTKEIILEYQKKYPKIIKPVLHKKNLYSQGARNIAARFLFPKAQGKYIALCEGDDYWTDPQKLQIQVDFLDSHPDYSICFHPVKVIYENNVQKSYIYPNVQDTDWYNIEELFKINYIPTNSVIYRKANYKNLALDVAPADWYLHLFHAQFGKIKYIDRVMSVYRKHSQGVWWNYDINRPKLWEANGVEHIAMHEGLLKIFGSKKAYRKLIENNIENLFMEFTSLNQKSSNLFERIIYKFPQITELVLRKAYGSIKHQESKITQLERSLQMTEQRALLLESQLAQEKEKLRIIETSRSYVLSRKLSRIKKIMTSFWPLKNV